MNTAPPPPTLFRRIRADEPPLADRFESLWRLSTTDEQRWEIERLADLIAGRVPPGPLESTELKELRDAVAEAVAQAVHDTIEDWEQR